VKSIVVLGGGADQIDLLLELKKRGFHTVLVDYYPDPVAKPYCDVHVQESTLNQTAVLGIARQHHAENIIATGIDQALLTVAYVAERLGFPRQFSYEQALSMTSKVHMKKVMAEHGIPTPAFKRVDSGDVSQLHGMRFPLMVKPSDSNGSFGVRRANNESELATFVEAALDISRSHLAIVEEFKSGIEVGVDAYVVGGKARVLMTGQVNKKSMGDTVLLIYQTFIPAPLSEGARRRIDGILEAIVRAFGLDNTPLLLQVLVDGDEVNVIEFAPRVGGASKHRTVRLATGFDILAANVDAVFGRVPDVQASPVSGRYSRNHIYALPSVYGWCSGYEELQRDGTIVEFIINKTRGMEITGELASRSRVANFLVRADTMGDLRQKIRRAVDRLEVHDIDGRPVMRRDIFEPGLQAREQG
jgi:biotin carboxylase